jgi:hypothetical protein
MPKRRLSTSALSITLRELAQSLVGVVMFLIPVACDQPTQTVALTAEDFRYVPLLARASSSAPLTLSVYNAGREVHEFDSPVLKYAVKTTSSVASAKPANPGIILEPGKSMQIILAPPPGTYLYICRRKGHANMTGTLIIEYVGNGYRYQP